MFIWLTNPTIGQVLVNLNLVTAVTCSPGKNTNVCFTGGEEDYIVVIRICPNAQAKMEADFLHEMIHGMLDHLGYTEHDEKKVDELANVLHMVILDNPAVFAPVREGQHENVCNTESEDR